MNTFCAEEHRHDATSGSFSRGKKSASDKMWRRWCLTITSAALMSGPLVCKLFISKSRCYLIGQLLRPFPEYQFLSSSTNMKYSQAAARARRSVTMLQRIKNCQEIQWVLRFANDCLGSTTHYHQHTPSLRLIAGSPVSSLQIFTLLFFWTPQMFFCRLSSFKPFGRRLCSKNCKVWSTLLPPITI